MRKQYLELFRDIANSIDFALKNIFGTSKAKEEISKGAFGDMTVYVDRVAEDIIIEKIKNSDMKCSLLSEEKGWIDFGAKFPVIIADPIDGSLNAKRGIPYFSCSLALAEGLSSNDLTVGYVRNFSNSDEFSAVKSEGSYFNGKKIETVSSKLNIIAVEGLKKSSSPDLIVSLYQNFNKVRQLGSVALDICYLSLGAFDAFLNVVPSRIIDYAAAKVILEESSGGIYCWIKDEDFVADISSDKGGKFFCVSNRKLVVEFVDKMRVIA